MISGRTYYLNIGAGGISSTNDLASVAGGDSWFNSNNVTSTLVLAKGGAGGQSVVTTTNDVYGTGGTGTTNGSIGNVLFAGGNGASSTTNGFGGGGGGSAGILLAGNAPASTTNGLGAIAVTGGGNGGNANPTNNSSANGQSPMGSPGGGGGGARAATTAQKTGGTGATGQVILTVQALAKADQTITGLGATDTKTYGSADYTLSVTKGASGSSLTFGSSKTGVATIDETGLVHITGAGETTITVNQAADDNYNAATAVTQTLIVAKAAQTITGLAATASKTFGDLDYTLSVSKGASTSGLTYASSVPGVATIDSNGLVSIKAVGTTTITVDQAGDGNYEAAFSVSVVLTVSADVLKYAFGSANGMPQNNGVTAVPVIAQLQNGDQQMTYTFDVKDDSPPLTVTYQTSTDLVTWTTAQSVSPGTGVAPSGFLKKQVQVTGSDRLFVRLNVTR